MIRFPFYLVFVFCLNCSYAEQTIISNVNIIDTERLSILSNKTVIIAGERIQEIRDKAPEKIPTSAKHIDGQGKYLSPGLVDAHIHLFQSGGLYTRPDAIDLRSIRSYEEEIQWLKENCEDLLKRYLSCGITTAIDVGGPLGNYALRDKFTNNNTTASLYLTGPLISTYQPEAFKIEDPPIVKVSNSEEARALVQKQVPYKPDFIKIWYIVLPGMEAKDNYDIVKATIEESHKHNLRVMVHATQLVTARLAVQAGADVLVHSVDDHEVDQEFIDLLNKNKTVYCPTLIVHQKYNDIFAQKPKHTTEDLAMANPYVVGSLYDNKQMEGKVGDLVERYKSFTATRMERSTKASQTMATNLNKLWKGGVTIATSTDAGNIGTHHASSFFEEIDVMQAAGMTPGAILQASTLNGAKVVDKTDQFGQVKTGLLANLILLKNNPLNDTKHLKNPELVIHQGHIIQPDTLIKPSPEDLAQQQLNAYNARDIDAFLAPYSDSVAVYLFPDQLQYKGKEIMRRNYAGMFENLPLLHCKLLNRVVQGNTVIDHEQVRLDKDRTIYAIAIYKIKDGKIAEVYFVD